MKKPLLRTASCLAILLIAGIAIADEFYPISSVSSSTEGNDLWAVSNLIQGPGVGIDANEPHDKILTGADGNWVTADNAGFPADYIELVGKPVISLDLGEDRLLSEISIWGYAGGNTNGVSEFSLTFATEAEGVGGGTASAGPFFTSGDLAAGTNDDTAQQSFALTPVTARYIELTAEDNFFVAPGDGSAGGLPGGDRVGLGEIAFAIPEPSSILIFLTALAGLVGCRRR